ncbi:MAG: glycosyltransferase family 2 protein [Bacteroidota bacterium]
MSIQISVVVMTYNEENNLERCLKSVEGLADETLIVDSFSTDNTVELAKQLGARVVQHPFKGFISQRKVCVDSATHDYVLALDADEVLSEELKASMLAAKNNWQYDCYYNNRLNRLGNKWIRHGAWYPDRKMRFFDRRKATCSGVEPHDEIKPNEGATIGELKGDLLHYMQTNIYDRVQKINEFSSVAAASLNTKGKKGNYGRVFLKTVARFWSDYLLKQGFRDGFYGFFLAIASAHYAFYREMKLMEMQRVDKDELMRQKPKNVHEKIES